jgi:small-conductance mechanosensitive channel
MLNESLRKETELIQFHEAILEECNYPEVREFINDIVDDKRELVLKMIQKLNEMHASSQINDGIISSFNYDSGITD